MEKENNRIIIIYFLLLVAFMIGSVVIAIFVIPSYFREYAIIANLLVWVGLFIVSTQIPNEHGKFKAKSEKIKTTVIIILIYYMLYFISGLLAGFKSSPYSKVFYKIIENAVWIVGLAVLQEYVRAKLVNYQKKLSSYILITIIFIIINIDITTFINSFSSASVAFKYVCGDIVPRIGISILCTYLATTGGVELIYAYVIPVKLVEVIVPIFPNLDWFILTIFEMVLVIALIFYNNYEHVLKTKRMTRREIRKENPVKLLPSFIILILMICFIAGILPYKPVAVMSNSMVPVFSRGDMVITKKIENIEQIKVGDIMEFLTEEGTVIHRVVEIKKDVSGKTEFITRGDSNGTNDVSPVQEENVISIEVFSIPYLGYPSVIFSEKVLGKKAAIQVR